MSRLACASYILAWQRYLASSRVVSCNLWVLTISVILVTGGISSTRSVELFHTNGTRICSLPDLPSTKYGHSQSSLTCCGGGGSSVSTSCLTFISGSWEESHSLSRRRGSGQSAWASPQGIMLLGGGICSRNHCNAGTSTEILLENGYTTPGFDLDYKT